MNPRQRSWLIAPAFRRKQVDDAAACGADVVVLDLVEFVPEHRKTSAREALADAVRAARAGGAAVFVQTDPQSCVADAAAAMSAGATGIVLSRTETAGEVQALARRLDELESVRGIAPGTIGIVTALETARGNHAAYEIATASPRVAAVTLGRADLVMDLRPEPSGEIHMMEYLMQRWIIIAGAAGVMPLGAWWRAPARGLLATPENTAAAARRGRAIGFKGALCLRPNQVSALNEAYR
ncbi:MAG: aldolase/citrate lyase family protein [Burkholderiales bacterium]